MANRTTRKTKRNMAGKIPDASLLPQNMVSIGERVLENKNIYISQPVYKVIHKFAEDKTTNESGGILVGSVIEEFGKINIVIDGFIEAKFCESTPTTLKFTHQTWEYCHKEIDKKYPKQKILGWIHTHPNFGIFLSEYDKFIHNNFFKDGTQIAYVIDPIQNEEGFYFWINENIERSKGFYIYDKNSVKIKAGLKRNLEETQDEKVNFSFIKDVVLFGLVILVLILALFISGLNSRISKLESNMNNLVNSANKSLNGMNEDIKNSNSRILELEKKTGIAIENNIQQNNEAGN